MITVQNMFDCYEYSLNAGNPEYFDWLETEDIANSRLLVAPRFS